MTEPPKKRRTLMDLFRSSEDSQQAQATDELQVSSLQSEQAQPAPKPAAPRAAAPKPAPEPEPIQAASAGGYVVQLSSFRSEGEARSEYSRLSSLYPTVVGSLPQRVSQTKIGGSTRYQLGLGPMNSRSEATRVCSALFSAGETDCIVRGQ